MTTCDICNRKIEEYHKIIAETYGICDNPDCEKKAREKARNDLWEVLSSENPDFDDVMRYEEFLI